ncbi:ABC transporter substrate-binding protein [Streptomyces sp. 7-21]|jgi:raffinose/stachyose/melibiose transport system substrate-binding protein|uniref:ABC transporter substrate-binding protein n=1 Tax=Streptomyces sp. 7-21 TaxID=2802283 RepID=UPI00191E3A4E|nr:extracellular solute-binding protein [Streptomyces sp. 7-21]MBL1065970.1 extracellular solute-binding protein [Streptomyces sp. 7-21]
MISRRGLLTTGLSAAATAALTSGCGRIGGSDGRVTLEFFQFKPEAVATFHRLIDQFEAEHPGIRVVQNNVPAFETAIRTRLVRGDIPDVVSLNGNFTFGEIASSGVWHDFAAAPDAWDIAPGIQDVLDTLGTYQPGEHNGLPFAANASGILYNRRLFAQHDVAVPTTWGELIDAARTFRRAGITPFYGTLADAWTSMPAFNALASSLHPPQEFFPERLAGRTTFTEAYAEVADKLAELYSYTQDDMAARTYDEGNQAFAQGQSAMYLMGSFAIPPIKSFQPDFEIGSFALPASDDPAATRLVSGADVALTIGRDPAHREEVMTFLRFLMRPDVMRSYADEQLAVPTLNGLQPESPELAEVRPFIDEGRIVGFTDHMIPRAVQLEAVTQQFLLDGDRDGYLATLDEEWDTYQDRHA